MTPQNWVDAIQNTALVILGGGLAALGVSLHNLTKRLDRIDPPEGDTP
jgi:hypothetical protein